MPVTLNPPPFPTADNTAVSSPDKTADAHDAPHDSFATLLHAAGEAPGNPGKDTGTASAQSDSSGAAGIDQQIPENALARGIRGKLPFAAIPVGGRGGRDPALAPDAGKLVAVVDTPASDKPDSDKPAASDAVAAGDLAGMTAVLSALLGNNTRPDAPVTDAPGGGVQGRTDALAASNAKADTAHARDDKAQLANVDAEPTNARSIPTAVAAAASALLAPRDAEGVGKTGTSKSEALEAPGAPQSYAAFQHSVGAAASQPITIATPVTAPGWQGEFADKLSQVVMTGNDRAEFRLHPANMGPVDVKISVVADQASLVITAPHAATREALEQALPQLRDLLASQGINLGQASVQSESRPSDQGSQTRDPAQAVAEAPVELPVRVIRLNGLVDVFA